MILHNTLYQTITMPDTSNGQYCEKILLNRKKEIFQAHFPNLPILPGACLVQISKELIENRLQQKIQITHFKNLKFLKTINPDEFPEIFICFSYQKTELQSNPISQIRRLKPTANKSQISYSYAASITFSKDEHLFCKLDYHFITQ